MHCHHDFSRGLKIHLDIQQTVKLYSRSPFKGQRMILEVLPRIQPVHSLFCSAQRGQTRPRRPRPAPRPLSSSGAAPAPDLRICEHQSRPSRLDTWWAFSESTSCLDLRKGTNTDGLFSCTRNRKARQCCTNKLVLLQDCLTSC